MTLPIPTLSRRYLIVSNGLAMASSVAGSLLSLAPQAMAQPVDDWPATLPEREGLDPVTLRKILDDAGSLGSLKSILVVRNGSLAAEKYYGSATASDLQALNSVTKSVTSMLVGIALERGKIPALSSTVGELLPEAAAKAADPAPLAVTLEQILTNTSGLRYDFRRQMRDLDTAEDPGSFTLNLGIDPTQPAPWVYNDAAVSLLSPILVRAWGMPIEAIAKRDLLDPLGISQFAAARDRTGNVMSYRGLRLRARDFTKLAWMMANDGRWGGQQVVSTGWVGKSTSTHVPTTWGAAPMRRAGYGYLWFTGTLSGHLVAWAWGYGAQFALIVPSLRLAVTTTTTNPRYEDLLAQSNAVMTLVARIVALAG